MSAASHPKVETLRDGSRVSVRPIRPSDAAAQAAFFNALSSESKHLLFLSGVAHLRESELERMCAPDPARECAYVAVAGAAGRETHVGVCRYASSEAPCDEAEISVAVADGWQHKGLATLLLTRLIAHAREQGVKRLYSIDSATNHRMRRLAAHLGFRERPDPDDVHQVIYTMDLT
jgi:RimJ/RimL family protein N-acetyltransferase